MRTLIPPMYQPEHFLEPVVSGSDRHGRLPDHSSKPRWQTLTRTPDVMNQAAAGFQSCVYARLYRKNRRMGHKPTWAGSAISAPD